mgnify:CR=1 FL=1
MSQSSSKNNSSCILNQFDNLSLDSIDDRASNQSNLDNSFLKPQKVLEM